MRAFYNADVLDRIKPTDSVAIPRIISSVLLSCSFFAGRAVSFKPRVSECLRCGQRGDRGSAKFRDANDCQQGGIVLPERIERSCTASLPIHRLAIESRYRSLDF